MGSWRNPEILEVCGRVFTRFQEVTRFPALAASYTFSRAKLPLLRRFYSRLPMVTGFSLSSDWFMHLLLLKCLALRLQC